LAILAALELGEAIEHIRGSLRDYRGIKKRFDIIDTTSTRVVIDDYGHHPTEIKATMQSLQDYKKMLGFQHLYAIWQPHKYTRTMDNLQSFVECFEGVDGLVILPIWSAGELEIPIDLKGAFSRYDPLMADRVTRKGGVVQLLRNSEVVDQFDSGLIVAFGAGDITYQIRENN